MHLVFLVLIELQLKSHFYFPIWQFALARGRKEMFAAFESCSLLLFCLPDTAEVSRYMPFHAGCQARKPLILILKSCLPSLETKHVSTVSVADTLFCMRRILLMGSGVTVDQEYRLALQ